MHHKPILVTPLGSPHRLGYFTDDAKPQFLIELYSRGVLTEHHIELQRLKSHIFHKVQGSFHQQRSNSFPSIYIANHIRSVSNVTRSTGIVGFDVESADDISF